MAVGPGKYDDLATYCLEKSKANAVILIVFNGSRGSGMSGKEYPIEYDVAMRPVRILKRKLPGVLRQLARDIEAAPEDQFGA